MMRTYVFRTERFGEVKNLTVKADSGIAAWGSNEIRMAICDNWDVEDMRRIATAIPHPARTPLHRAMGNGRVTAHG